MSAVTAAVLINIHHKVGGSYKLMLLLSWSFRSVINMNEGNEENHKKNLRMSLHNLTYSVMHS